VKVHHALGDSHTIIAALACLFDAGPDETSGIRKVAKTPRPAPRRRGPRYRRVRAAARVVRGLGHLAAGGPAPTSACAGRSPAAAVVMSRSGCLPGRSPRRHAPWVPGSAICSVGILADDALVPDADKLAAEFTGALGLYQAAARASAR
jgi:hypothetical protein